MNTYLKITILVLAAVSFVPRARLQEPQALADMHPMIVRISDVSRAEAIDYQLSVPAPEAENKYYLSLG